MQCFQIKYDQKINLLVIVKKRTYYFGIVVQQIEL